MFVNMLQLEHRVSMYDKFNALHIYLNLNHLF